LLDPRFVLVGAALQVCGCVRYVSLTLQGRALPHRLTWLLWSVAPLIAFAAEVSEGVGIRAAMTLLIGLSPLAVLTASFLARQAGGWALTRFDLVCGVLSVLGLVLWQVTGRGNVAIGMSLFADAAAAGPTVRTAVRAPETESYATYLTAALSAAITLLTLRHWTFADAAWPVYIAAVGSSLVILVRRAAPAGARRIARESGSRGPARPAD
jgi:hypothetical protein